MFTRILTPGAFSAALLLGVFSQQAAATEEIVVNGTDVAARIEARHAMFQTEMDEYIRSLNERIKATLQETVKIQALPKMEVASSKVPVRG
jgi:hypothetical protein